MTSTSRTTKQTIPKYVGTVILCLQKNKTINVKKLAIKGYKAFINVNDSCAVSSKQSLNMPGAHEFTNMQFDPRPNHLRHLPGYQDYFNNICLNSSGISEMPISQTVEPANAFAVWHMIMVFFS